jgi:hypothetical protein
MTSTKSLTWDDRIALINHFNPSDTDACRIFGITAGELHVARNLEGTTIKPTKNIDYAVYAPLFGIATNKSQVTTIARTDSAKGLPPATGSKPVRAPRKRGRQGNRVEQAFAAIPRTPTPIEQYAVECGVSLNALRQGSRFDKNPELGRVRVKKDKQNQTLMIWRDSI